MLVVVWTELVGGSRLLPSLRVPTVNLKESDQGPPRLLKRMSNVGQQLLSGALSGLATTICLQPFDLLKTRMQQGDGDVRLQRNIILGTARDVVRKDGVRGLWRGTEASLMRNVPGVALYMTTLTQLRTLMATSPYLSMFRAQMHNGKKSSVLPTLTPAGNLLAGATTRVAVGFLLNPFSVLKARYESNMAPQNSFVGIFLVFYEGIKRRAYSIIPATSNGQATVVHTIAAASAGAIGTFATHPFDVIKTKMQVRSEDRYSGLLRTSRTIWMQRGVAGFFDGVSLRMTRKVGSSAIGWAVYEGVLLFVRTDS
ncbi:putative mitochondrial carrier [Lyophyllum shimeji]|uniref:Mitochondrial carrier n=1 Tax=Lyophyllum shimeji TaxID=47721 RepID=A0A9P3PD78_LYOSH|nr:putative mitochondrial carrier [Lyophyllum shimeji]